MKGKDYYAILEVAPGAPLEQIKQSYRRLARLYHPDVNKEEKAHERIKQLNEAYETLSNTAKRAAYDARRLEEARNEAVVEAVKRMRAEALNAERMTWTEGVSGFVREFKKELGTDQPKQGRVKKMSWAEGLAGFKRELKKGLQGD